jgi:O-acetyl-ADP-ribose deacetylase
VVATGAYRLPARWVIHTVGPNRHAGQTDPALLASCFRSSLQVASSVGAATVALPAVSAGVYGWAGADVARIAVAAARAVDDEGLAPGVELARFVLFGPDLLALFEAELA